MSVLSCMFVFFSFFSLVGTESVFLIVNGLLFLMLCEMKMFFGLIFVLWEFSCVRPLTAFSAFDFLLSMSRSLLLRNRFVSGFAHWTNMRKRPKLLPPNVLVLKLLNKKLSNFEKS